MQLIDEIILKNYCRNFLNEYFNRLNENSHIADCVYDAANRVANEIQENVEDVFAKEMKKQRSAMFENHFTTTIFGRDIKIEYKVCYFRTDEDAFYGTQRPVSYASYQQSTQTITVHGIYVGNSLRMSVICPNLQHEIEHLYQSIKSNKKLINTDNKSKLYDKIVAIVTSNNHTDIEYYLAIIAYFTFNEERAAYLNNIYSYLMHTCKTVKDVKVKYKKSVGYRQYNSTVDAYQSLCSAIKYENEEVEDTLVRCFNGKSSDWFINNGKKALRDFSNKLKAVLRKAEQDIEKRNNII